MSVPGATASLTRQVVRGLVTGVLACTLFALGVLAGLVLVGDDGATTQGEGVQGVGVLFTVTLAVVLGAGTGVVPGALGGLAAGLAARRLHTRPALRAVCAVIGAASGFLTVLVPAVLGLGLTLPVAWALLSAAYGAGVGALHGGWAARGGRHDDVLR